MDPLMPLGAAVGLVRTEAAELLPPGYSMELQARAREFAKTSGYVRLALLLALALVYIVLASQFNSFLQPLIVMTAQPLAIVGGLFALWITGTTLNLISMIGLVLLMGLVAKNSILLVDLTNQLREQGQNVEDALRNACPIRLRPVLMSCVRSFPGMTQAGTLIDLRSASEAPMIGRSAPFRKYSRQRFIAAIKRFGSIPMR